MALARLIRSEALWIRSSRLGLGHDWRNALSSSSRACASVNCAGVGIGEGVGPGAAPPQATMKAAVKRNKIIAFTTKS